MTVEVFLDEQPGETRGIIARDGWFEHLLIHRDADPAQARQGARSVGRIMAGDAGVAGAFVDLGDGVRGFLALKPGEAVGEGTKVEVEVIAEPRDGKGPTLKRTGQGSGEPRLLVAGPDVRAELARLAPGIEPVTGLAAIQASWDAEEEAGFPGAFDETSGADVRVERTRAMIAVDIDLAATGGRDAKRARDRANADGLKHAARLIRLKRWGGLVAVDLVGTRLDGEAVTAQARRTFGDDPAIGWGPVNKFGVLMLSLPWRRTPLDEVLSRTLSPTRAMAIVRSMRHALLSDTTVARVQIRAAPEEAEAVRPYIMQLGPRAVLVADPSVEPGRFEIE